MAGLVGTALAHEVRHVTLLVRPRTHTQHPGIAPLERPYDSIEAPVRIADESCRALSTVLGCRKSSINSLRPCAQSHPWRVHYTIVSTLKNGIEHVNVLPLAFEHGTLVPATILVNPNASPSWPDRPTFSIVRFGRFPRIGEQKWRASPPLRRAVLSCEFQAGRKKPWLGASSPSLHPSLL